MLKNYHGFSYTTASVKMIYWGKHLPICFLDLTPSACSDSSSPGSSRSTTSSAWLSWPTPSRRRSSGSSRPPWRRPSSPSSRSSRFWLRLRWKNSQWEKYFGCSDQPLCKNSPWFELLLALLKFLQKFPPLNSPSFCWWIDEEVDKDLSRSLFDDLLDKTDLRMQVIYVFIKAQRLVDSSGWPNSRSNGF